jgi:hypothetical protein
MTKEEFLSGKHFIRISHPDIVWHVVGDEIKPVGEPLIFPIFYRNVTKHTFLIVGSSDVTKVNFKDYAVV